MSYSPDTRLAYIPVRELPGYYNDEGRKASTWTMTPGDVLGLKGFFDDVPKNAGSSSLLAWDPVQQKKAWSVETPGATSGGVLSTRGGLVFQGRADGKFQAHDASTGETLWSSDMGVGTQAPPITYEVDGKQYVSVLAGWAGGQMLLGTLSAQHGWVGREHPRRLLTYVLDGEATLPPTAAPSFAKPIDDPAMQLDPAMVAKGRELYSSCVICHGVSAVAGGYAPDLRASPIPLSADAFKAVVQGGGLEARGMPRFEELSDDDLTAIRHYIRERSRYKPSIGEQLGAAWDFIKLLIKMKWKQYFG